MGIVTAVCQAGTPYPFSMGIITAVCQAVAQALPHVTLGLTGSLMSIACPLQAFNPQDGSIGVTGCTDGDGAFPGQTQKQVRHLPRQVRRGQERCLGDPARHERERVGDWHRRRGESGGRLLHGGRRRGGRSARRSLPPALQHRVGQGRLRDEVQRDRRAPVDGAV